jgi:hypothetical protein
MFIVSFLATLSILLSNIFVPEAPMLDRIQARVAVNN